MRAGQKKTHVFLEMRGLNLMRALISNREKKHSGLIESPEVNFGAPGTRALLKIEH